MPIEKLRPSFTFTEDRIKELKQVVPEAFADGKINWDVLGEALGEHLEDETQEHFGLTWPGKREARRLAAMPSKGTLVPRSGEGVNEETTRNIFIEGENLEVLKLLQKSYAGRIKMIYIDPPYNTGNDFIYNDNYTEPLETYLLRTKQLDEIGIELTTNTRSTGRFHSQWLNMMYPRLLLARQLLREDGVIFVSIDDNEMHNLRQIMEEIFGPENYVSDLAVIRAEGGGLAKQVVRGHDLVFIYSKNIELFEPLKRPKDIRGKIIKNDGVEYWIEEDWLRKEFGRYGTCPYDEIEKYHGLEKKKEIDNGLQEGRYVLIKKTNHNIVGRLRRVDEDGSKFYSVIKHLNAWGVKDLKELGISEFFQFPKPVSLLKQLILGATFFSRDQSDIVLDYFAGSCTTAHALLQQNQEDSGNRQFIMIQIPEISPSESEARKAGFDNIADIGKERVRRVIKKLNNDQGKLKDKNRINDLGFKVLRLEGSAFQSWKPYSGEDSPKLESLFDRFESPLVDEWNQEDLLIEILLLEGYPLDSQITPLDAFAENKIQRVNSEFCAHDLFVCLDESINEHTINQLDFKEQDIFVCLDTALSDEAKAQLADRCNLKVI
jgi:adenine-specific DNA-methyltransferase